MKRFLLAALLLALCLHWLQAWQRCRRADQRTRMARDELGQFEAAMKEWPELESRASHLQELRLRRPADLRHQPELQLSFRAEEPGFYRMRLHGPRAAVIEELLLLNRFFWVKELDLGLDQEGQVHGSGLLLGIP